MAMKVQGGKMVPVKGGADAKRIDWLKNREFRLKEALKSGNVEMALGWVSDIQASAKPGDVNPTKLEIITQALREAKSAIARAENAANRVVTG
jgi:hypothetical protein